MCRMGIGPSIAQYDTEEIIRATIDLAERLDIMVHGHLAESKFETQYTIFEREQGQRAFVAAQTIMDSIGAPVDFDADTDKEVVKTQLLKMMIQYFFGIDEYEQQVHYMQIAEPFFRETDNLMDLAGCYNIMGISCQRMGQFNEAIHYITSAAICWMR